MASKKIYLKKVSVNGCDLVNFTEHIIRVYQHDKIILTVDPSSVVCRVAYVEISSELYGNLIPINKRKGSRLVFYHNGASVSYSEIQKQIGSNSLAIVSNICLSRAIMTLGKAVSPGTKIEGFEFEESGEECECRRRVGRVLGCKNFITE